MDSRISLPVSLAAFLIAVVLFFVGSFFPFGLPLTLLGLGLLASFIYDKRYKPASNRPAGPGWVDTGERFIDPETRRRVAVFMRPETGEREYHEL
jgi:hypothetical protein